MTIENPRWSTAGFTQLHNFFKLARKEADAQAIEGFWAR
jgi:hypothetical protein